MSVSLRKAMSRVSHARRKTISARVRELIADRPTISLKTLAELAPENTPRPSPARR